MRATCARSRPRSPSSLTSSSVACQCSTPRPPSLLSRALRGLARRVHCVQRARIGSSGHCKAAERSGGHGMSRQRSGGHGMSHDRQQQPQRAGGGRRRREEEEGARAAGSGAPRSRPRGAPPARPCPP
eukprot:3545048-Rhodomonas_salina.1